VPHDDAAGHPAARRQVLLTLIRAGGQLEVAGLPERLGVSAETLRRDLRALEEQGAVRRGYGVAYAVESGAYESALTVRSTINAEEKRRIAHAVVQRIGEARTVYLDEGYQTELVAGLLPTDGTLTVVTPSLPVATLLASRPGVDVVVLGGRVRVRTLGVVDYWAAEVLSRLTIDLALIGANGISVERGLTTPDPAVAEVKAAAVRAAVRRVFVGAHHKFGAASFVRFAQVTDLDLVVTGRELPAAVAGRFGAVGVPVLRV
jgi:DeoR/GlpR family transcriptional regulator of sugar metabolism